jgi:hypothetical protein
LRAENKNEKEVKGKEEKRDGNRNNPNSYP